MVENAQERELNEYETNRLSEEAGTYGKDQRPLISKRGAASLASHQAPSLRSLLYPAGVLVSRRSTAETIRLAHRHIIYHLMYFPSILTILQLSPTSLYLAEVLSPGISRLRIAHKG